MSIKKILVGLIAAFIFGIVALFIVIPVLSQGPALPPGEYDLETGQYVFNVPELQDTPVAPTDTPVPPTDTPIPPTDTPVPSAHNDTEWHPLTEEFAHEHGDDPSLGDSIFGPLPGFLGGTISYPWQTFRGAGPGYPPPPQAGSGDFENDFKHEGYKWSVGELPGCDRGGRNYLEHCVVAWRIQYHALGGPAGATARVHSSFAQVQVCTDDLQTCGFIEYTGGHEDFGCLEVFPIAGGGSGPEDRVHVPLPDDPDPCKNNPYKHHEQIGGEFFGIKMPGTNLDDIRYNWRNGVGIGVDFAFTVRDDWQAIDPNDPFRIELQCPDFQCPYNHSLRGMYVVEVGNKEWLEQFDPDVDGLANYDGFTDRWSNPVPECSPVGVDCIPLKITNVPVGWAGFYGRTIDNLREFDISPPGEFWIEFPN